MLALYREAWSAIARHAWNVVRFASLFRLYEAIVFIPLSVLVGQFLSGRTVVDSTDLVSFLLSPWGFASIFSWVTLLLVIRLVEQAGLSAIMLGSLGDRSMTPDLALSLVARLLPRLLGAAAWILLVGVGVVAPCFAIGVWIARPLLSQHDINYYFAEHPPEFRNATILIAAIAVPTIATIVWLAVRWRLVAPVAACEPGHSRELLRSSARIVQGHWRQAALAWLTTVLIVATLGLLSAWIGRLCGRAASWLVGDGERLHFGAFVLLVVVRTVLISLITLPGTCVSTAVFAVLYRSLRREQDADRAAPLILPALVAEPRGIVAARGWALGIGSLVLAGMSLANTIVGLNEIFVEHTIEVAAHRGGTTRAVENTVAAVREAIEVGAQYAEIDVQMSRDEVLVVTHDSDFSRLAGVPTKVWELTWDEIRSIPLSKTSSPPIVDHVPTFDDVLDAASGRIHLNVELKYYGDHQPQLAERVVAAIRSKNMSKEVIIQSLHYAGLEEVRRAAPEIPVGYLFSVNARSPQRLEVDFLSVQLGRVDRAFVSAAHRRGQPVHVWTVDKAGDMERMINLGVDNLITNRPQEALELIRAHETLSPAERALRRLQVWLSQ